MTGVDQLRALVVAAPDDTTFTARSLRQYLAPDANPAVLAEPAMTAAQVAAAVAAALGMTTTPKASSVRKWVRTGLRGVKLTPTRAGRGYGYTRANVRDFIERALGARGSTPAEPLFMPTADPADEVRAFERRGR